MVQIKQEFIDDMVAHAKADLPNECWGILAGPDDNVTKVFRMTNVAASPFRFEPDPKEQIQVDQELGDEGWDLLVEYHSHTKSEASPSDTDVRESVGIKWFWPDVRFIVVSLMDMDNPAVRIFDITDGVITEEPLEIVRSLLRRVSDWFKSIRNSSMD